MAHPKKSPTPRRARLVPRGDGLIVHRQGVRKAYISDVYAVLIASSWTNLLLFIAFLYLFANFCFACFYLTLNNPIENARPGSFSDAYFFSVQTMATIGYGKMVPKGLAANILVTLEALFGFSFFALLTGLVFSKFSRPKARVLFSHIAVIGPFNCQPHLTIRLANERGNRIVDATVELVLVRDEVSKEGHRMRRFHDLKVLRDHVPVMQYTWSVMHPIDKESLLFGMTTEKLKEQQTEIIVAIKGHDETLAQSIYARYSYVADEIICDAVFEDILTRSEETLEIDFKKYHATKKSSKS